MSLVTSSFVIVGCYSSSSLIDYTGLNTSIIRWKIGWLCSTLYGPFFNYIQKMPCLFEAFGGMTSRPRSFSYLRNWAPVIPSFTLISKPSMKSSIDLIDRKDFDSLPSKQYFMISFHSMIRLLFSLRILVIVLRSMALFSLRVVGCSVKGTTFLLLLTSLVTTSYSSTSSISSSVIGRIPSILNSCLSIFTQS